MTVAMLVSHLTPNMFQTCNVRKRQSFSPPLARGQGCATYVHRLQFVREQKIFENGRRWLTPSKKKKKREVKLTCHETAMDSLQEQEEKKMSCFFRVLLRMDMWHWTYVQDPVFGQKVKAGRPSGPWFCQVCFFLFLSSARIIVPFHDLGGSIWERTEGQDVRELPKVKGTFLWLAYYIYNSEKVI